MVRKFDFLVIGSGIAGMSFALKVAHKGKVALICKSGLEEANTYFAQGGVASVTNLLVDNFDKHIEDTMIAGDWISDRGAVEKVVREAPAQIEELIKWGVDFDKNEKGEFDLHREGGHSEFRILHHKDNTGAEIQDSLIKAVQRHPNIEVIENQFAVEILTQHHLGVTVTRQTPDIKCYGAYILDPKTGKVDTYLAKVTLMATGGVGAVYKTTTNPLVATGGRYRHGLSCQRYGEGYGVRAIPPYRPVPSGRPPFVPDYGSDCVATVAYSARWTAREVHAEIRSPSFTRSARYRSPCHRQRNENRGDDHVYSTSPTKTGRDKEALPQYLREMPQPGHRHHQRLHSGSSGSPLSLRRYPRRPERTVFHRTPLCSRRVLLHRSSRRQPSGFQLTDRSCRICRRRRKHSLEVVDQYAYNEAIPEWNDEGTRSPEEMVLITQSMKEVNQIMSTYVGIVRSDLRLKRAWDRLDIIYEETESLFKRSVASREICELRNMVNVGYLIMRQAMERKESRGLHYTIDYPHAKNNHEKH